MRALRALSILTLLLTLLAGAGAEIRAAVPVDLTGLRPGPVKVASAGDALTVDWNDAASRAWRAEFSLDASKPLITAISVGGKALIERAQPLYRVTTGKRRGGWDAFFDFPPSHPEGTRQFQGQFQLRDASAKSLGERVEVAFNGLRMGIFEGSIRYVFYPGSRLIQQLAVASTQEPDTAYFYDAGLRLAVDRDRRPGNNMESEISFYDASGEFRTVAPDASERQPAAVRHRTIAARTGNGSVALFPAPHQYFFARDYTTNMGYLWHTAWRGNVSIGVRQLPDDNSPYYPWMNAPPGTEQRMGVFLLADDREARSVIDDVLRYTHRDRFPQIAGHKTLAAHWHFHYTGQAVAKGFDWIPPFKPVLKAMGVDAAMIMDFHGDGHPRDLTDLRLEELKAFYDASRAQSDAEFLLIPSEEANVHLGGHWAVTFPKQVLWFMDRRAGEEFHSTHPKYGPVYRVANEKELLDMVRREGGYMYQTHPRTKGSTGYPDKIRETEHFRDPRYLGAGWKAMPSDLSSPRLGERAFRLLDDMNNWGLKKRLLGEVDVFQIDATHELYAHMNINYVRAGRPEDILEAWARGDYFVSTGEVLLPEVRIAANGADRIAASAKIQHTFPLAMIEVVWGDGSQTHRQTIPQDTSREFGQVDFQRAIEAKGWKWARLAVWDIAGNGAFTNPVWR
jgi:hypothetical protein